MDPKTRDELVEHFDHHDPRLAEDPHAVFTAMRERCPVQWSDKHGGFWVVSSYELVYYALQHYELFTTYPTVNIPPGLGQRRPLLPMEVDPPEQLRYRRLIAPVFAPQRITALEPRIREICDSLIGAIGDRGECEFMRDLAAPLPTMIFADLMGLPYDEAGKFHRWKNIVLHGHHEDPSGRRRAETGEQITAYLTELRDERKARPRDDLMSLLSQTVIEGERLSDDEILDITYLLFLAGLDTVTNSAGLHFLYLAQAPEQRDRLVREPALIPQAVEELLRYESVVLGGRTATQDLVLGGVKMRKGDRVLLNTASANRDPLEFPEPERVIFGREPNRHIAFAVGPHRCVGSHLARLELRVLYEQMHARIPNYRLCEGAKIQRHVSSVMGIEEVPLVWES